MRNRSILDEHWGAKVIDRLTANIRTAYPAMSGLSSRNLRYMRSFATTWTSQPILQQLAAKLPWGHHMVLLDTLDDQAARCWYAAQAIEHGWSRSILNLQIGRKAHARHGRAANNFKQTLPSSHYSKSSGGRVVGSTIPSPQRPMGESGIAGASPTTRFGGEHPIQNVRAANAAICTDPNTVCETPIRRLPVKAGVWTLRQLRKRGASCVGTR